MLQDLIQNRKEKLNKILKVEINPYPDSSRRTHTIGRILDDFEAIEKEKGEIVVAGRIRGIRGHGGSTFIHIDDESGRIQAYLKQDILGPEKYKFFKNFDIGDFIELQGTVFVTQKGERTLLVSDYKILAKSIRPLPEKWKGLSNQEIRFRERYLDLLVHPEVRERFRKRAEICDALRDFLTERGFLEVETPVLQTKASGALARPFITEHEALQIPLYLRIAPETYLKRLIVGGLEKVFEMARVFRNEGMDTAHLQDFTMLEFYWAYKNYEFLMAQTEEMLVYLLNRVFGTLQIDYQGEKIDFTPPWQKKNFRSLILEDCGIDINKADTAEKLRKEIQKKKIEIEDLGKLGFGGLVDQLYKKVSRPKIKGPLFLTGHPIELSPLARRNDQNPKIVDRFQLVVLGQELVNAYSELVDPLEQRRRFEEQVEMREAGDAEAHMMDEDYVRAMEYGMPPIAGWGMGVDRLVMFLTNAPSIREAVFFPLMRPLNTQKVCPATKAPTQNEEAVKSGITRAKAWDLVCQYVKNENSRKHMLATEAIMRALAKHFQKNEEVWGLTGLLHDLDMEMFDYRETPEKHGPTTAGILEQEGVHPVILAGIKAHNDQCGAPRKTLMEKAIYAVDPLTGLIVAATLVLPSKKLSDLSAQSVLKRFKEKSFAQGARREVIASCESFGLVLEEFIQIGLRAMQDISQNLGL
ncbi:MAG: lysine--tRNA ligase [Candidatus Doudnabacteria bacterium]